MPPRVPRKVNFVGGLAALISHAACFYNNQGGTDAPTQQFLEAAERVSKLTAPQEMP